MCAIRDNFCDEVSDFFQREEYTCCVACLRCVLWLCGQVYSEERLHQFFIEANQRDSIFIEDELPPSGYTMSHLAEVAYDHGLVPRVYCLTGTSHTIGSLNVGWAQPGSFQEGSEEQLIELLKQNLENEQPAIIYLYTKCLDDPYNRPCPSDNPDSCCETDDSRNGGHHAVVVVGMSESSVSFLEVYPLWALNDEGSVSYAECVSVGLNEFKKAWRKLAFLMLLLARRA